MMSFRAQLFFAIALLASSSSAFCPVARDSMRTVAPLNVVSDPRQDPSDSELALASQDFFKEMKIRANELSGDAKTKLLAKLESKEFQDQVKQTPGRAYAAFKGFIESEEVKSASSTFLNAVKGAMESDEAKALKARAAQAFNEALKKKETN